MFKKLKSNKLFRLLAVGLILSVSVMAIIPATPVFASTDLNLQVNSSTDDANYYMLSGAWSYSGTLAYGYTGRYDVNNRECGNGMVFDNVTIPVGATIDDAYIEVQCYASYGTAMKSKIYGYDAGTATDFDDETDYKNRFGVNGGTDNRTTANVDWNDMAAWTPASWYQSPDIKTIIQEIVNRGDWASGNGVSIVWNDYAGASGDTNARFIYSYNTGAGSAPKLHITYTSITLACTTVAATNVAVVSAQLNGTLDNLGGEASSDCYFEWDTDTGAPYANSTVATADTLAGAGAFNETITGLTPADQIFFRTVTNNGVDTVYGAELNFTLNNYVINYYGDSITVGTGASVDANCWQELVEAYTSYTENNDAVGATRLYQQYSQFTNVAYTNDSITMALLGYNDMRYFGTNAGALTTYGHAIYSALAIAGLPSSSIYEADNVNITYTGSWGNATPYTGINTKYSGTAGSTATATLTGSTVYVDTIQYAGYSTGLQVSIDGVSKGTFYNSSATDVSPYLLRFTGLTNAAHTVVCTVVGGAGYTYINWMGASDGSPDGGTVYVAGSIKMQTYSSYAPYNNGSDAAVTSYNSLIQTAVTDLVADGLDIIYVDVNSYFVVATDFTGGDGVHPNDTGHDHIADAFIAAMSFAGDVAGHTDSATAVTTTTATLNGEVTDMGGEGSIDCYFQYGTTVAYGTSTIANKDTLAGIGAFDVGIGTLLAGTTYHFRAVLEYGGAFVYGADMEFTTTATGSVAAPTNFKIDSYSATSITLSWTKGGGATNTLIKYSLASYPTDTDEGTQLYSGVGTTTTHSGLVAGTRIYYSAWSETGGTYSTTYVTVTGIPTADVLSAPDTLEIETVQIYRNYVNLGDQLIVFSSKILWNDGTPTTYNASDFFYVQVLDAGIVIKQDRIKMWGYVPNSLYISNTSTITWNKEYTIRLIGTNRYTTAPSVTYTLTTANYRGSDWDELANWALDLTRRMQDSTYWDVLLETSGTDTILNTQGTQIFNTAIAGLSTRCPQLFYPVATGNTYVQPTQTQDYSLQLEAAMEEKHGQIFMNAMEGLGLVAGQDVKVMVLVFWFGLYIAVVIFAVRGGAHGTNALLFAYPIVLFGAWMGGINLGIPIAIAVVVIGAWLFKHTVQQGG
jgi:hypothetical protein